VSAAFTGHRAGIMIQVRTMPVTRPSPALVPAGGHCHTVRQGARFKFATSAWLLLGSRRLPAIVARNSAIGSLCRGPCGP
jgi:hypothetical protein